MIDYFFITSNMTYSYSRLKLYESCPYSFYLTYILGEKSKNNFYGEYGTFVHTLLSKFYQREITKDEMLIEYLTQFDLNILSRTSMKNFEKTRDKYFSVGADYIENFNAFKFKEILGIEEKFEFNLEGYSFTGFIDLYGIAEDGEIEIIDHKSKDLSPRSKKVIPTLKDIELDNYLIQLYLYCIAIYNKFGKYPKRMKFNCFKAGKIITEDFNMEKFEDAKKWALRIIKRINADIEWLAVGDYIFCNDLCNNREICEFNE